MLHDQYVTDTYINRDLRKELRSPGQTTKFLSRIDMGAFFTSLCGCHPLHPLHPMVLR